MYYAVYLACEHIVSNMCTLEPTRLISESSVFTIN